MTVEKVEKMISSTYSDSPVGIKGERSVTYYEVTYKASRKVEFPVPKEGEPEIAGSLADATKIMIARTVDITMVERMLERPAYTAGDEVEYVFDVPQEQGRKVSMRIIPPPVPTKIEVK